MILFDPVEAQHFAVFKFPFIFVDAFRVDELIGQIVGGGVILTLGGIITAVFEIRDLLGSAVCISEAYGISADGSDGSGHIYAGHLGAARISSFAQ